MKIEDIENSVPLTQDKVNDNEDHNNEKLKAPKKPFWKSPRKISILALTILIVFIIVVIGCSVLHFTLTNSKGKYHILLIIKVLFKYI
jgi:t-SNARE complex subunit (syntaxin)